MSNTRQKLIEYAFELFGRSGFHAVGLDQVIAEVGCSKQTFYNHFESKDDLILAVLKHRHERESKTFDEMLTEVAGKDPRDRLYGLFDALQRWFTKPEWKGCIFMRAASEFPSPRDPAHQLAREHTEASREFLQYMATLAGALEPAKLSMDLAILLEGVVGYHHLTQDEQIFETARRISHQLLDEQLAARTAVAAP